MKDSINEDLMRNIKMDDEMKEKILRNCRACRRTKDFTFRYSTPLMAALMVVIFSITTITVSAAIISYRQRLKDMDEEEVAGYETEVVNDTFISTDEGFSRELTDNEIERALVLERKYYDEGVFPEKEMPHYKTYAERAEDEVAYIEEDNKVYLPESDMTDEQLLEYIDHDAKKRYINIQQLLEEGIQPGQGIALESTVVAAGSGESKAVDVAKSFIKENYSVDIDDSYVVLVEYFPDEEDEANSLYNLFIYQRGLGYGNTFVIRVGASDFSVIFNTGYNYKGEL